MPIYLQCNKGDRFKIEPTIFPDKTSQIWKIEGIDDITPKDKIYVYWEFAQEAELIWLCQLLGILERNPIKHLHLIIPYLPYARQDKNISNYSCFSSWIFQDILNKYLWEETTVHLLDAHSNRSVMKLDGNIRNNIPYDEIKEIFISSKSNLILFPDAGAFKRYSQVNSMSSTHCIKKRNQLTGIIESIKLPDVDFKDKRILIVDDICDGGGTFIEISKQLTSKGATNIELYISHGIFSKGMDALYDAGIYTVHIANYEKFYERIINES